MLAITVTIIVAICGVAAIVIGNLGEHKNILETLGFVILSICVIVLSFLLYNVFISVANSETEYTNKMIMREVIEYNINNIDANDEKSKELHDDILAFNASIKKEKDLVNNPWIGGIFGNEKIASIEYIGCCECLNH